MRVFRALKPFVTIVLFLYRPEYPRRETEMEHKYEMGYYYLLMCATKNEYVARANRTDAGAITDLLVMLQI